MATATKAKPIQSMYPRLRTARPPGTAAQLGQGYVDWQDVNQTLLRGLEKIAERLGIIITIFSGFRTSAYSASVGGFAGDPHTKGIAVDATVGGKPIGQVISQQQLSQYGILSGNTPNFYKGKADPSHVQLSGSSAAVASAGSTSVAPSGLQTQFAQDIYAKTGLDPTVVFAWEGSEGAYQPGGTGHFNMLNLKGRVPGSTGLSPGGFAEFPSLAAAETASIATIAKLHITELGTPRKDITEIAASPWDTTHYGGTGGPRLRSTYVGLYGEQALDQPMSLRGSDVGPGKGLGVETAAGLGILGLAAYPGVTGGLLAGLRKAIGGGTAKLGGVALIVYLLDKYAVRALEIIAGVLLVVFALLTLAKQAGAPVPRFA